MKRLLVTRKSQKIDSTNVNPIYQELFLHFPDALFLLGVNGEIIEVNNGLEKLTGYSKDELVHSYFSQYVHEEDIDDVINYFVESLAGNVQEREFRIIDKANRVKFVSVLITASKNGEFSGVYGLARDITEKKRLELAVKRSEVWFESLIENSSDVIGVLDENGKIIYQSQMVTQILGYEPEQLIGTSCFDFVYHEDLEIAKSLFTSVLAAPKSTVTAEIRINKANGDWIYCQANIKNLLDEEHVKGIVVNYRDISERKSYEDEIQHIVYHDSLTGLPNRNLLENVLVNESAINRKMALLFIDLDRFKVINDSLGYNVGDSIIQKVTDRLKSSIGEKDILFRQGGDEFFVLLADTDRQRAKDVSEKIIKNLSSPIKINHYDIFISPSIGIGLLPDDGKAIEHLVKHAEYAMYQAKKHGRNTYRFYSSCQDKPEVNPLKMEMDLHKAIEKNELILHYQPKMDLKTGKMVGVEALIRWSHPELGMVSPADFIPLAEETGLIIPIGKWALQTACTENKKWQEQGFPPMVVSVNLSLRQFSQSNIVQTVADVLAETGLDPEYLDLEITESMTANISYTIKTLQQLKQLGVQISIDDFGTGFSSLNYLKEFPVDTLKVDQSFVRELHNNANDQTIVKTIISMARNLNLNVVAEGIETKEQLLFLQQHFCSEGQGYLFSKPLPVSEINQMLFEIENVINLHGVAEDEIERMWGEEIVRLEKNELKETLRRQQGMTLKFKKVDEKFVHTLCAGELIYRLGMLPEEVVGRELSEFLPYELAEEKERCYQKAWSGEEQVTYEAILNGIHYMAALRPIKRGRNVVEVIVSCIDITKLKEVEKALRESEEKYRLITENVNDLICILDDKGEFEYASPSFEKVLGIKPDIVEQSNYFDFVHPEDAGVLMTQFTHMVDSREPFNGIYQLKHAQPESWILAEVNFTPIINEDHQVKQIVLIARDITEKRQAEELLWKFEKLSIVGELAAGVAHEIRNPLTSIKGFVQLFQQGLFKQDYCDVMIEEFKQIDEKLNEFLALSKTQAHHLVSSDPKELLEYVEKKMKSTANLLNVQIILEIEKNLPAIICDPNQIRQVFINLVKNSIEAMPNGGLVKLTASQEGMDLLIKVIDEGTGISKERIETLGEPFYSNKEKGTGLGLMVSYRIIRDHKGTIFIHSEENNGTVVEVRLPINNKVS